MQRLSWWFAPSAAGCPTCSARSERAPGRPLTALGLVLIASTPEPVALYLSTAALAAGVALQYPALITMTVNRVPERERSVAVATFTMFFDLAQGLGGAVLGQVAALGGIRATSPRRSAP